MCLILKRFLRNFGCSKEEYLEKIIVVVATIMSLILTTQEIPFECANFEMQYALRALRKNIRI